MELPANMQKPKLCQLKRLEGFAGYGFNLHSEKGKPGQFVGKVDPDSPAKLGGLCANDVLIEVNGVNVEGASHSIAVDRVKSIPGRVDLFVCSQETYEYCKDKGIGLSSTMQNIEEHSTPQRKSTPPPEYQPDSPTILRAAVEASGGASFEEVRQENLPERFRSSPKPESSPQPQQRSPRQQQPQQDSKRDSSSPLSFTATPPSQQAAVSKPTPPPSVTVVVTAPAAPAGKPAPTVATVAAATAGSRPADPLGNTSLEEVRARLGQSKRNQVKMLGGSFSEKYSMFESL